MLPSGGLNALADHTVLAVSPLSGYRALRERWLPLSRGAMARAALRSALFQLFAIAVFVSLTAAGRLVAAHLLAVMAFWSFGPVLQLCTVALVTRIAAPREPLARTVALYFAGQGPWMFFLAVVAGMPVIAPALLTLGNVGRLLTGFFVLLGAAILWGGTLTFAFFRGGLELPRGRASLATVLFYLTYVSLIVGYYLTMNQIQPQLFGTE